MIVHTEIDHAVIEPTVASLIADDQDSRRLFAPFITPCLFGGFKGGQESLCQRPLGFLECLSHVLHHGLTGQDIALTSIMLAHFSAGPRHAFGTGVRGGLSFGVNDADLADRLSSVLL